MLKSWLKVTCCGAAMMKILLGSCLVAWFLVGDVGEAWARLGDDEKILIQKHGEGEVQPEVDGMKLVVFRNENLSILVYFRRGLSVREVYSGVENDPKDANRVRSIPITPEFFDGIMRANSAGKLWLPLDRDGKITEAEEPAKLKGDLGTYSLLVREDGKAVAQIYYDGSEEKIKTIVVSDESLTRAK